MQSDIAQKFSEYTIQYDTINDRYERLVKLSRDVTIGSKRLIFLIHRIFEESKETIIDKVNEPLRQIRGNLYKIAEDINGQEYWRYQRAFSPGVQEFIEAVTLYEFVLNQRLIRKDEIEKMLLDANLQKLAFRISLEDYLLGICDLTGELMRLCINAVSSGSFDWCTTVCLFLQEIYHKMQSLPEYEREMSKKLIVMATSVQKVEVVNLTLQLRGSEYPKELLKSVIDSQDDFMNG